ncbi:hypothetical protein [Dyadobacter crusticola]|uniref:hypothetical protein n=1 Tax=Dyadobacter crusticola TaxID=292407 RepID=UPI0004E21F2D|nr:hypothetical protein [Dyadobacter crusticola]
MKRLLSLLFALALVVPGAFAQTLKMEVALPDSLVGKGYLKNYVKQALKDANVKPDVPTAPVLKDCKRGPVIREVLSYNNSSITVQFDGEEVYNIAYDVYLTGAGLVKTDSVAPKTSIIKLPYGPLPNGVYTLKIRGKSCKSADSETQFNIKSDQGSVDIPVPPVTAPGAGKTVVKKIVSGLKENMNIYFVTLPDGSRLFSDSTEFLPVNDKYEFQYGINNHIIKQSVPLKNYRWPANTPLQIWKAQIKKGLENIFKWGTDGGWWDAEGGQTFSHNDFLPFASFLFQPADSAYDVRRQTAHWMDFMPDMQLPKGKIWVMPIGVDDAYLLIRKGVTHFSNYALDKKPYWQEFQRAGRMYNEVPKTDAQFGLQDRGPGANRWVPGRINEAGEWITVGWPNNWNERFFGPYREGQTEPLTYEEGREAGRRFTVSMPVVVFENKEQDHAISTHWAFVRGFTEVFRERLDAEWLPKGIQPAFAWNYFTKFDAEGLTLGSGGRALNKKMLRTPISEWPGSELLPGGTLEKTNLVCYAYYLKSPDLTRDEPYKFIYSAKIANLAGIDQVLFPQSTHEHNPNNFRAVYYPDGTFFKTTKQEYNPAEVTTISFLAQCFGRGIIPWGASPKNNERFRFSREWHYTSGNLWLKRGANDYSPIDQFPYWDEKEEFAGGLFEYSMAEGIRLYIETFAKVIGGQASFLDFRLDGKGDFRNVDKESIGDVVDAYHEKRGVVYAQEKDGQLAVFYLNPYADTDLHTVEYRYKGKVYSMTVHSTLIKPVLLKI